MRGQVMQINVCVCREQQKPDKLNNVLFIFCRGDKISSLWWFPKISLC